MTSQTIISTPVPVKQARIFVADDDTGIASLMQDLLQDEGYSVILMQHAKNAYEEITETLPDLVTIDITLERQGDGWLILNKLRHNPNTACIPVIICSADIRGLRARQEDLNTMGYLVIEKPFDIDALLNALQEGLFGSHRVKKLTVKPKALYGDIDLVGGFAAPKRQ